MDATAQEGTQQDISIENSINVAGYSAFRRPELTTTGDSLPRDDGDGPALEKLWWTGFNVNTLEEAHEHFQISPLRDMDDLWKILGYGTKPGGARHARFTLEHTTALAFQYPDPSRPGQVFDYNYFIRLRPRSPVESPGFKLGRKGATRHKYEQPSGNRTGSHSEPYFLITPDMWTRVMSAEFPLYIVEGELKAASLGLMGHASIGFPGAQMMYAPSKAGKNRLHHALDPDGPRKGNTIPIRERDIVLTLDSDYVENKNVRTAFQNLVRNLVVAGADSKRIRMLLVPPPDDPSQKNGIDDFVAERVGVRWSSDRTGEARTIVENLLEDSKRISVYEFVYKATSHVRGAERFVKTFDRPTKFIATVRPAETTDVSSNLWAVYNCDHYKVFNVNLPLNNTSSKVAFKSNELATVAKEIWDEGVRLEAEEGDAEGGKASEMNADFPNRLFGLVGPQLPAIYNETLIETFEGVDVDDRCIRIRGGLININKCFDTGVAWGQRSTWLLPPNHRWFGTGQVNVCFTNLEDRPTCPTFLELVHNMFAGDETRIECLQKAFGKILLAPMFLDRNQFFAFYGTAGSGKSTMTNMLINLLGQHDVGVLRGNFGGRFDTSELPGKRLILFPENEDGSNHHFTTEMASTIKKITGRDMIICEKKGQQPLSMRIDAEIMIVGNAPPTIEMDEEAFLRRAVFLRADAKIEHPDPDKKNLMDKQEMPGIFLWALEGACKLYHDKTFVTPECCKEDLAFSTMAMNLEKRFVEVMVVEKAGKRVTMTELEEAYRVWLRHLHLPSKAPGWGKITGAIRDKFNNQYLAEPGKDGQRKSVRVYRGLTLAEMQF